MKSWLKAMVKRSKLLYFFYFYCGSLLLQLIGYFVKTDPDLVLFVSYGGQKYDDSPRVIYEYLLQHPVSPVHKYVWAFIDPNQFPQVPNKVRIDTPAYYLTAMRAGIWITNSSASRGLRLQKKETRNFLFQHGMAGIKKLGRDIQQEKGTFHPRSTETFNAIFIEGKKEIPLLEEAWGKPASVFYTTGLPRNDDLVQVTGEEIARIKAHLGIAQEKKVILYAPTFRETSRDASGRNALGIPFDFAKWKETLGERYVLLVTAHYEVAKLMDKLPDDGFVYNAFKYPELNDLLKVADILISDYSSIVFDYSILERPIFCYAYDYDTYLKERGLYTDLEQLFSHGVLRTEDALIDAIKSIDYEKECAYTREHIKSEYIAAYGNAAEKAVKVMFEDSRT